MSNFVLAFVLTISEGVTWTADWKFESEQDCKMISEMVDFAVVSGNATSVDKQFDCIPYGDIYE